MGGREGGRAGGREVSYNVADTHRVESERTHLAVTLIEPKGIEHAEAPRARWRPPPFGSGRPGAIFPRPALSSCSYICLRKRHWSFIMPNVRGGDMLGAVQVELQHRRLTLQRYDGVQQRNNTDRELCRSFCFALSSKCSALL